MDIRVIVVGKPRRDILPPLSEYLDRLRPVWPTEIVPVAEEKLSAGRDESEVMRREAERIRAKVPAGWSLVALDRTGRTMDSVAFAKKLRRWQDDGMRGIAFAIGGPVGLDPALAASAALRLSLGPMTFPHDLSLLLVAEQVYRAMTIVQGWPYHR